MKRKSFFTVVCLFFVVFSHAQDRQLNKIDRLYEQELYQKSLKKAEKLIEHKEHRKHPLPYLYQSLNLLELSQNPNTSKKYRLGLRNAMMAYEQFRKRDPQNKYAGTRSEEVENLHQAIKTEAERMDAAGKKSRARYYHRQLAEIWKDTTAAFLAEYHNGLIPPKEGELTTSKVSLNSLRDSIVYTAEALKGVPYKYGGQSPKGFDCSGFTGYAYQQHHLDLPRSSSDQGALGIKVPIEEAQKGDLAFFGQKKGHSYKITHVALVVSNPGEPLEVIHATSSKGVMTNNISDSNYWRPRLLYVMNVLDNLTAIE